LVHSRYLPHVQEYKRSWKTDETILRLHILPRLGPLYLDEVTPEGVAELVRRMRLKGYASGTTNRVVILLRYVFNLARKWKLVGVIENPTAALQLAPETHRDRFLTEEETKRLLVSIAEDETRLAAQAVLLLLLTGARRNEITHARWEQIDWRRRTLLVPQSKSGKPRKITLNGQAIALLKGLSAPRATHGSSRRRTPGALLSLSTTHGTASAAELACQMSASTISDTPSPASSSTRASRSTSFRTFWGIPRSRPPSGMPI